jgi:ABC-type multidrug transport system fused ATPase/permease subunit
MKIPTRFRYSYFTRSLSLLKPDQRRKLSFIVLIQISLSSLDLLGVGLFGILAALAINGVGSKPQGNTVSAVLDFLNLNSFTIQQQAMAIGLIAAAVLVLKTVLSIYFTRRTLYFLSRRGASISSELISKVLSQPLIKINEKSSQEILFSVTTGVQAITLNVLGLSVIVVTDVALLIFMATGLLIVDPIVALSTFLIFFLTGFALFKLMHRRASRLGRASTEFNIESNRKILEILGSYRESVVKNRRSFYANEIGKSRIKLADTLAELAFMPSISKYVIEGTVLLGSLFISGVQFALKDAVHAIGTLAIFLAAGSRVAPAVLRIQQSLITISANLGTSISTLDLVDSITKNPNLKDDIPLFSNNHAGFIANIDVKKIEFSYPSAETPNIQDFDLQVKPGEIIAIVGPSGAGKTTFVDLLLGILQPNKGQIIVSGVTPLKAIETWPGAIAYVPQDVMITDGTIKDNVVLGFPSVAVSDELVWEALKIASLDQFVRDLPGGIDSMVGERGSKLSGGQRQRLGIARAMITKPSLLVLDEATSALDSQIENEISESLSVLKGSTTIIIVAHRLSTVKDADKVVYLESGKKIAEGTFSEVRSKVTNFDAQAKLNGF